MSENCFEQSDCSRVSDERALNVQDPRLRDLRNFRTCVQAPERTLRQVCRQLTCNVTGVSEITTLRKKQE